MLEFSPTPLEQALAPLEGAALPNGAADERRSPDSSREALGERGDADGLRPGRSGSLPVRRPRPRSR